MYKENNTKSQRDRGTFSEVEFVYILIETLIETLRFLFTIHTMGPAAGGGGEHKGLSVLDLYGGAEQQQGERERHT